MNFKGPVPSTIPATLPFLSVRRYLFYPYAEFLKRFWDILYLLKKQINVKFKFFVLYVSREIIYI